MDQPEIDNLAQIVWDYLSLRHPLHKADLILALGSHDIRVAQRAADLFKQGLAPLVLFSGGFGRLTGDFPKPEAEVFAEEAVKAGIPQDKILIENKSTNTGENISFSLDLLKQKNLTADSFILITKPYMERRAYATFKRIDPTKEVMTTSPLIDLNHASHEGFSKEDVINIMVGDLQRVKLYPEKGYQIYQEIPESVWHAYEQLVDAGYTKQLIS